MNRQQRRARDKIIKKSKEKNTDMEQKLGLFDLMPKDSWSEFKKLVQCLFTKLLKYLILNIMEMYF